MCGTSLAKRLSLKLLGNKNCGYLNQPKKKSKSWTEICSKQKSKKKKMLNDLILILTKNNNKNPRESPVKDDPLASQELIGASEKTLRKATTKGYPSFFSIS